MRALHKIIISLLLILFSNTAIAAEQAAPEWSYDQDYTGQEDWGSIKGYETCRNGTNQSPVNIGYTKSANLPALIFKYKPSEAVVKTTDHSFITEFNDGGTITDGNKSYSLKKIEIHSPGEHHIKDSYYPVEIHLIHKDKNGNTLIVAVLVDSGNENSVAQSLIDAAIKKGDGKIKLDSSALLPDKRSYYLYNGSYTYPPCKEGVRWVVMKHAITVSKVQISRIVRYTQRNARLVQPIYMRDIQETSW